MNKISLIITLFLIIALDSHAQEDASKFIYQGNNSYKSNNYKDAEIDYRKSLEKNPNSSIAKYNLANSLYKQGNYQEAMEKYKELSSENFSKRELSKVFHNLGNSLMEDKKYQESVDAYINALKNNPKDEDTKYNLAYAREMLRKQQQQDKNKDKDKNDKNDKNKDKQDQNKDNKDNKDNKGDKDNKNKDQQNQDQQDKDNQKGDKDKDKQNDKKDSKDGQQDENRTDDKDKAENGQKPKISKQDAERILQAMMNDEKELQKKLRKLKSKSNKTEKNW
ncbi:MAG: tetratricopeptide repeat protein [Candidatus Kapaibacterium sp.]|nr:tetratricopeptide repeat protein [Ignavibacteriota bacterium]MCB9222009.1 tetratricopeptide repeat protein [Ignavibacteria bacterium]